MEKQEEANHYEFRKYVCKKRWGSYYHQIDEIVSLTPSTVLEVGGGGRVLAAILKNVIGIHYESIDIDEELKPDHIGSVLSLPFSDKQFDVVAAFQVLEHLPYENFETALSEMFRTANKAVIISLPNAAKTIKLHIHKIAEYKIIVRPFAGRRKHRFNASKHHWEINRTGYHLKDVLQTMNGIANKFDFTLTKQYRIWEQPFHHMFVFENFSQRQGG